MIPEGRVEKSIWLRETYPTNRSSRTKRKSICGFGVNDADYVVNPRINGNRHPCHAYTTWRSMIERCVDGVYKNKHPAYRDAVVCDAWVNFMTFREWYLENYVEGFDIDKDLLSNGGKVYSPETCIFIPRWLNIFISIEHPDRALPAGVHFEPARGKYKASVKDGNKTINIGRYDSVDAASRAYVNYKLGAALARKSEIESISRGLYERVVYCVIEKAR